MFSISIKDLASNVLVGSMVIWVVDLAIRTFRGTDKIESPLVYLILPFRGMFDVFEEPELAPEPERESGGNLAEIPTADRDSKKAKRSSNLHWVQAAVALALAMIAGLFAIYLSNAFYDRETTGYPIPWFGDDQEIRAEIFYSRFCPTYKRLVDTSLICEPVDEGAPIAQKTTVPSSEREKIATDFYYDAKNVVWNSTKYTEDLRRIRSEGDVSRALAAIGFLGVWVCVLGFVAGLFDRWVVSRVGVVACCAAALGLVLSLFLGLAVCYGDVSRNSAYVLLLASSCMLTWRLIRGLRAVSSGSQKDCEGLGKANLVGQSRLMRVFVFGLFFSALMFASDQVWSRTEKETNKIVFGVYSSLYLNTGKPTKSELSENYKKRHHFELTAEHASGSRSLSRITSLENSLFEPSGLVVTSGTPRSQSCIIVVNDKDRNPIVYSTPATSALGVSLVESTKVGFPPPRKPQVKGSWPKFEALERCEGPHCSKLLPDCADEDSRCIFMLGSGSFKQPPHLLLVSLQAEEECSFYVRAKLARTTQLKSVLDPLLRARYNKRPGEPFWYKLEALADLGDGDLLVGVRAVGDRYDEFGYRSLILSVDIRKSPWTASVYQDLPNETSRESGETLTLGISGLSWDSANRRLLMLRSSESSAKGAVYSVLEEIPSDATSQGKDVKSSVDFDRIRKIDEWDMKAEGVDVGPSGEIVVVFDNDKDRKKYESARFDLAPNQDFVRILR